MDETDKKIRELTEAMRAEWDVRIRSRMMAVRRVLAGYPTRREGCGSGQAWLCPTKIYLPNSKAY